MNTQIFKPHLFHEIGKLPYLQSVNKVNGKTTNWFLNHVANYSKQFHIGCAMVITFGPDRKWTMGDIVNWIDSDDCEGKADLVGQTKNGTGVFVIFFENEIDAVKCYLTFGDK